jgi:PAS domain S-box-containing protein
MKKILVVDDEAAITTHLEAKLTHYGYEVVGRASSGEEAITKARLLHPDLILMDIVMPGPIDGIEAARRIKKELNIPVIFLTAYGDDTFIQRAQEAEPSGYIIKPFQDAELKAVIKIALYNKKISDALQESFRSWQSLAKNLEEAIILANWNKEIFFWNKGAEIILGYRENEVLGKPINFFISEGTDPQVKALVEQSLSSNLSDLKDRWVEIIGVKKDFTRIPLEVHFSSVQFGPQESLLCLLRDITTQKRFESQLESLVEEKKKSIHHLKHEIINNLQLISRLIELQSDYLKPGVHSSEAYRIQEKILNQLKTNKDLLKISTSSQINFASYLKSLISRLSEAYDIKPQKIQIKLSLLSANLCLKQAVLCGLIVSELVSNAFKHAFPGNKRGTVEISYSQDSEGYHTLKISDNGCGLPKDIDPLRAKTPGFRIVSKLAEELEANITIHRAKRTIFTLRFRGKEICE